MHDATERKRARGLRAVCGRDHCVLAASPALAAAAGEHPTVFGIPVDFILFALTLIGVAVFHRHTLQVALTGLAVIVALQARLHRLQDRPRLRRASSGTCTTSG